MSIHVPPEYLPAEARPGRIAELEQGIAREWVRFALVEALMIWFPFSVFLAVYALTDAVSDSALVPVMIAFIVPMVALTLYWLFRRVRPLERELVELRALGTGG